MLIEHRVDKVLRDQLGAGVSWDRNTSLCEASGLALDNLDMVELAMALEEEFQISVPEDEFECGDEVETVGDIVDYLGRKVETKGAMFG